jgi:hypothetical protein
MDKIHLQPAKSVVVSGTLSRALALPSGVEYTF